MRSGSMSQPARPFLPELGAVLAASSSGTGPARAGVGLVDPGPEVLGAQLGEQ